MRFIILTLLPLFAPLPALANPVAFDTPSGNISCSVAGEAWASDIICTIYQRSGPPATRRLADCEAPHSFEMFDTGRVVTSCGPPRSSAPVSEEVRYGVTRRLGGFTCRSESTGLTCTNEDGHGFFLSRRTQRVF